MRSFYWPTAVFPVLFFALSNTAGLAQPARGSAATDNKADLYKNEAMVWEHFDTTIRMHADGTGDRVVHVTVRLQSEGAARLFSVLSVPYASAYETGTIEFIHVRKPDGTVVDTPVGEAIEMPAAVTRETPLYSDLKEKQLPVRSLSAGDVLDYQFHVIRTRAEAPGKYWGSDHFLVDGVVMLAQTLTLEVPASMYVQVWSPNHAAKKVEHDGVRTYTWTSAQLKPTAAKKDAAGQESAAKAETVHDPDEDEDGRKLPSVAWTTFHSWAEVGDWYRELELSRAQPSAAVKAKAEEVTKGAATPDAQVRALYDFVSTKTRYVGIDFGVGRYQPHEAGEVLDHQYGDCKDKDTLFEALLRAKNFTTAPALIGVNVAPVQEVPSPAFFNHVITTVEVAQANGATSRVWLDTTPEVEPYQELIPLIRDEFALVVPVKGEASLQKTPAGTPFPYFETFEAEGKLDKDGLLKSHMAMTLRSDNEYGFRAMIQRVAPAQWDEAMQSVSGALGFGGTVSQADFKQTEASGPVRLSYEYSRSNFGDWDNHRILPLFPVLEIANIDKDKAPERDIDQGEPRTLLATTRIQLPDGYRADVPDAVHVKRGYATFDKTYRMDKGALVVERKVVILKRKIAKTEWKDYLAYLKETGVDSGENYIPLILPAAEPVVSKPVVVPEHKDKPVNVTVALAPDEKQTAVAGSVPSAAEAPAGDAEAIKKQAFQLLQARDFTGARNKLLELQKVAPDTPRLLSMLASVELALGNKEEAIKDLEKETKHPDVDSRMVVALAELYTKEHRTQDALKLLQSFGDRKDVVLSRGLAQVQSEMGDREGAVKTLQAAAIDHPDDRGVQIHLSEVLHRLHRDTEAAAAAKASMEGSEDAMVLNNGAYQLAETRQDLPMAEAISRRSVAMLEAASTTVTVQEVNSKTFQQTENMVASWDTLGWILFLEGRPTEAEPYIMAAWFHRPGLTIGDHLAQVRAALGKPSEALTIDELALSTATDTSDKDTVSRLKDNVAELRRAGAHNEAGNAVQSLQDMRSFPVPRLNKTLKGWGSFRLQLANTGVLESDLVSGPEEMRAMIPELKRLKMEAAVPAASHGRLVRDGVLSCSAEIGRCELVLMPQSNLAVEGTK